MLLAMATLLQGYLQVSDAEAVEMTVVDLRRQIMLDASENRGRHFRRARCRSSGSA